ncbi:hypothetical protein F5X99DRAFT_404727 [Biscogniauxia marginata]|nr:hypothetical protein F5X99DRAFT_404727 [Biscogniauxia marginata]
MWFLGFRQPRDCIINNHKDVVEAILSKRMAPCCGVCRGCVKRLAQSEAVSWHRRVYFGDPFLPDDRATLFQVFVLMLQLVWIAAIAGFGAFYAAVLLRSFYARFLEMRGDVG